MFAIPELDRGGPDRVIFELVSSLDRARFEVSVLVGSGKGYYFDRLPADVAIEVIPGAGFWHRYPVVPALRAVRRYAPDVVFATQRMTFTMGLISAAFPRHTKLVLRQANDVTADFAALVKQSLVKHRLAFQLSLATLRRADAVVCQSHAMERDLRSLLGKRAPLRVIHNPIDIAKVEREATASTVHLPGAPALVSVGRFMPQKGYDLLLPAIALMRAHYPGLHLTIYGDGPDRGALETQRTALGLDDAVTFAGYTSAPLPAVRAAKLFVLASRYEGFPNAALEALACGTPVALTDCPGANAEIVEAGKNGRLAASGSAAAIADAIERALADTYDPAWIIARCDERFATRHIVAAYERLLVDTAPQV